MQFSTLVVLLLLALVKVNAKGIPCSKYIITQEGDQCNQISGYGKNKEYYIRPKELLLYNPSIDCDYLEPGTKVCVEYDDDAPIVPNKYYKIRSRDTCEKIARRLKTTPQILERVNPNIIVCSRIKNQVGNVIEYQKDGDYEPTYSENSKLVQINY